MNLPCMTEGGISLPDHLLPEVTAWQGDMESVSVREISIGSRRSSSPGRIWNLMNTMFPIKAP